MNIETVFCSSNEINRRKIGEIFQLQDDCYSIACLYCSNEYKSFSQFTLHIQIHLQRMLSLSKDECSVSTTSSIVNDSDFDEKSKLQILEIKVEPQKIDFSDDYNSDGSVLNNFVECNVSDIETKVNNVNSSHKEKPNRLSTSKRSQDKLKKVKKTILFKRKLTDNSKYKQLLSDFQSIAYEPTYNEIFNAFKHKITTSIFPSNVKDTSEIRLLAKYVDRGYKYEMKDESLLCPICKASYKDSNAIRRHILTHIEEAVFECGQCSLAFRDIRYLRRHITKAHLCDSRTFECVYCHESFKYYRQFSNHMEIHQLGRPKCKLCDKTFKMQSTYQWHLMHVHGGLEIPIKTEYLANDYARKPTITSFECYMCRKNFRLRRQLRNHLNIHNESPSLCLFCGILCRNSASLNHHMKNHDPDETFHLCTICGKTFKRRRYLLTHRRNEHKVWADNQEPICRICNAVFDKKSLLHEHMKIHPFEEERKFICTICNHAAQNSYNLQRHILTHTEEPSFECNICHKSFRECYAKQHMRTHEKASLQCTVCSKYFKRPHSLKQHMYQHNGGPEHNCDICGQSFTRTDKLLSHRRKHSVPLNYHCRTCNKGFISQKSFELHEAGHFRAKKREST